MKNLFFCAFLVCYTAVGAFAQSNNGNAIVGTWIVQDGTAKVKIDKVNGKFMGKFVWLKQPTDKNGKPVTDSNNPDKNQRMRTLMGLQLLSNFVYDGDNVWADGDIYDPDGGDTYSCKITYVNNSTIEVRGYVGISLFGRTETWKRCNDMVTN